MDEIKVGDRVRSFDFSDRETVGPRACFIEGTVTGIGRFPQFNDCDRYEIRVEREMFGGEECDVSEPEFRYPPVNGTRVVGRAQEVTDGVVLLESAESRTPLPWHTYRNSFGDWCIESQTGSADVVGSTYSECDAEFIVKACNHHDELLLQLQRLERIARDTIDADGALIMACDNALAAIAKCR